MKIKNLIGSLSATALVAAGAVAPVFAADGYDPVAGTTATFEKYFVMDKDIQVPNATFKFTVTAGTAVAGDATHSKILAGVGTPTIADVTFSATDTASVVKTGKIGEHGDNLPANKQYAKKTATIDFSSCHFTEPGVYRYVVTETGTNTGVTNDTTTTRVMDVFVIDNNGSLEVSSYVMHKTADGIELKDTDAAYELADKSDGFVNTYTSADLIFGKEVTGNQGNKNKDFTFTLKLTGAAPNTKYSVDYSKAREDAQDTPATGTKTVIETDEHGAATRTFKLKDGEYISVKGIAEGVKYELTEDAQDYTSTAGITQEVNGTEAYDGGTTGTFGTTAIKTGFTNSKNGLIPTGILLETAPYVAVMLTGGGTAFLVSRKRKEEN